MYRSAYKNARRLAATESNIEYRTADYERWQQLDFVVGIRVVLSNNHTLNGEPFYDICDRLRAPMGSKATKGRGCYPKDFKFTGWHPLCRCHTETILKTLDEMRADEARILAGEPVSAQSENTVYDVPQEFKDWLQDNANRIMRARSLPYFIKDNKQILVDYDFDIEAYMKDEVFAKNNTALENSLGRRGFAMSFMPANMLRGNPHYYKSSAYRVNCQSCVVAYEMRRRGFIIQTLPNTKGSALEKLSYHTESVWLTPEGKIPTSTIVGIKVVKKTTPTGYEYTKIEKTAANRKQLVKQFESAIPEDGRYHIKWNWKDKNSGHIITVERKNGKLRYYDPQNGRVIDDFIKYIDGIDFKGGLRYLRVDDLRVNPDVAKNVLTKRTVVAKSAEASVGGVTGRVTSETIELRKKALQSGNFQISKEQQHHTNLLTSSLYLGKKPLERIINHCVSADEIDAVKFIWEHPDKLQNPRISPLGEGKDMSTERVQKNIYKKRKRGVVEYVEYEFEYSGEMWLLKTEHHYAGFEQFYHLRKK